MSDISVENISDSPFWFGIWKELRPHLFAAIVEFGRYCILWAGVLCVHVVKWLVAIAGIGAHIVSVVSSMEYWVWIASFALFFVRVISAAVTGTRKAEHGNS